VFADVWVSMGQTDQERRRRLLEPYRVDERLMELAAPGAIFLHCLPPTAARRSPARSSTGPARSSSTRPRTACTPRRRSWSGASAGNDEIRHGCICRSYAGADLLRPFHLERSQLRGRAVRLGETVDYVLRAHAYPGPVSGLLGELLVLAGALAGGLKFDGTFSLQARGDGPVRLLVADCTNDGQMRGYAGYDEAAWPPGPARRAPPGRRTAPAPRSRPAGADRRPARRPAARPTRASSTWRARPSRTA
jgi:hypothetical protein